MKTYIYGETFIKTKKNLYCISSINHYLSNKLEYDIYIMVNGFTSKAKGQTNSYTFFDGNEHIKELRSKEKPCFNRIDEKTRLYKALIKRIN